MLNKKLNNNTFYTPSPWYFRLFQIYIQGDIIQLLPLIIGIMLTAFYDWRFTIILSGLYWGFRGIGEMIYWLLQQFGKKEYRPECKYKEINNYAVYIIYQTAALRNIIIGFGIVIWTILYLYS